MERPHILVTRPLFAQTLARLSQHFRVDAHTEERPLTKATLIQRLQSKQGVLAVGGDRIDAEVLEACPGLRICANFGVGYDNLDIEAMTRRGVLATNAPDVLTETTADFAFALLMATARRVTESERFVRTGQWNHGRYDLFAGCDVHGSTLGIIGLGRIGQAIARRAVGGFDMRVLYHKRTRLSREDEARFSVTYAAKDELLQAADHVLLVLPFSAATRHTIGERELSLMKATATLVNVARGGIVDDEALARALRDRRIAAAGLDVFEREPNVHPDLLEASNIVLTPHIASATIRTRRAMAELAAENLIAYFLRGVASTPINPEVLRSRVAVHGSTLRPHAGNLPR